MIKNDTDQVFIASNKLNNVQDALLNGEIYKILGVMNLNQIYNLENVKEISNWISVTSGKLKSMQKSNHFAFSFKIQNLQDLLSFQFTVLDSDK